MVLILRAIEGDCLPCPLATICDGYGRKVGTKLGTVFGGVILFRSAGPG